MLQNIRDRSQGWLSTTIVGIVCFTFVVFGLENYLSGNTHSEVVAKANGQSITRAQWDSAYQRLRQQQQLRLGDAGMNDPDMNSRLRSQALEQLIDNQVLGYAAEKAGLDFSLNQAISLVHEVPMLQENGQFSPKLFDQMLEGLLYTEQGFLENLRTAMLINEMRVGIHHSAFALPKEAKNATRLINERRDFSYIVIPVKSWAAQMKPSEQEIKDYYETHQRDFQQAERARVEYVIWSLADAKRNLHPTAAELQQYYHDNISNYTTTAGVTHSFKDVRAQVETAYLQQAAEKSFADGLDQLSNLAFSHSDSLKPVAEALKLSVQSGPLFMRSADNRITTDSKQSEFEKPEVRAVVFTSDVLAGNNSPVITLSDNRVMIVRVSSHTSSTVSSLDSVRATVVKKVQEQLAAAEVKKIGEAIVGMSDAKAAQKELERYHLSWSKFQNIGRFNTQIPSAIVGQAFRLTAPKKGKVVQQGFVLDNGDYLLLSLSHVQPGAIESKQASSQQRVFMDQLANNFGQLDYNLYVQEAFKAAKIKHFTQKSQDTAS